MRIHGDRLEQALATLVVYAATGVVCAADAGHAPAEGVAVTLVAFEDLVSCFVVGVAVGNVGVSGNLGGLLVRELSVGMASEAYGAMLRPWR